MFSPKNSIIRNHFQKEEPTWLTMKPDLAAEWGAGLQSLEGHKTTVKSIAFSHDSKLIASASLDGKIMVWSTNTGECVQELQGCGNKQSLEVSVTFSHDSALLLASTGDYSVNIWNTNDFSCVKVFEFQTFRRAAFAYYRLSFAVSEDSNLLVALCSEDTRSRVSKSLVEVWSIKNGKRVHIFENLRHVVAIDFYNSTQLISVSSNGYIRIWDMKNGACQPEGYGETIKGIAFSNDKTQLASVTFDGNLEIQNTSRNVGIQILSYNELLSGPVALSHNSEQVAASKDSTVIIWNTNTRNILQKLQGHGDQVSAVAFSHDSKKLASASKDGTVMIWDLGSSNYYRTPENHIDVIRSLKLSPCHKWLASTSSDCTAKIWNSESGDCHQTLRNLDRTVPSIAFSHDSKWLATSGRYMVRIWDTQKGSCLKTINASSSMTWQHTVFSKDSLLLASLFLDNVIEIFDSNTGKRLRELCGHLKPITSMKFSHDSKLIASGSMDSRCKIWDVSSGACLMTLDIQHLAGHSSGIESVAFSGDSTLVASASNDLTIRIWKVATGDCLQTLRTATVVHNISFEATNQHLRTDFGMIVLDISQQTSNSMSDITIPRYKGWALSPDRKWIVYDSEKMIWFPSEYRPTVSIVSENTITIANASGKVQILRFDNPEDSGVRSVLDV